MAIFLKQWSEEANAGDAFSPLVVSHLCSAEVEVVGEAPMDRPNLIGLGSILHWADSFSTVWGTGFIDPTMGVQGRPRAVLAVRGKLTAKRLRELGLPSPAILGDPGVFAPEVFPRAPVQAGLGVVPHYVDMDHPWINGMRAEGAAVIDPRWPLPHYMQALSASERIVASSLHGLVFAHAYGIPAAWVRLGDRVLGNGFKFRDYFSSLELANADREPLTARADVHEVERACWLPAKMPDKSALRELLETAATGVR